MKRYLPWVIGIGIPFGLVFWVLVVRWIWGALVVPLGVPVLGYSGDAALALLCLLVVGVFVGLKEGKK